MTEFRGEGVETKAGSDLNSYEDTVAHLAAALVGAISITHETPYLDVADATRASLASVLFRRTILLGASLQKMLPASASNPAGDVWDSAGALTLSRSMIEASLALFYLCTDEMTNEDFELRKNLMFLHDSRERPRILSKVGSTVSPEMLAHYDSQAALLKDEIRKNKVFSRLPAKRQKVLLEGKTPQYLSQDELFRRLGWNETLLRGIWEMLSSHAHSYSFGFLLAQVQSNRGSGRANDVDKNYCRLAASAATFMLERATVDMQRLVPSIVGVPRGEMDWNTLQARVYP